MQRKMTRFALAGKCATFGARGLASFAEAAAANDENARYPNPDDTVFSKSRRVIENRSDMIDSK
jgi:hypothetical protein